MRVRPATEHDISAIARVHAQATATAEYYEEFDADKIFNRMRPRIAGYLAGTYDPSHALAERTIFVAEQAGQIIGYIAGHRSTRMNCNAELQWAFVSPDWQRQAVGSALLQPLAGWFIEQQSTRVIVDAPPEMPSRAFYVKHGAQPLDGYWLYWPDIRL